MRKDSIKKSDSGSSGIASAVTIGAVFLIGLIGTTGFAQVVSPIAVPSETPVVSPPQFPAAAPIVPPAPLNPLAAPVAEPATGLVPAIIVEPATGLVPAIASPPPAVMTERSILDLGDQPDKVTFTFQEAPWPEVLREFAQWSGLTLDLTDTPPGYFSYFDSRAHTPAEAIDILNGYLLPRGFVLLRRDQFLVALKTDNNMLVNLIPTIELADLDQRGDNELVRVVVPVNEITPEVAAEEIRGLLGPYGAATPLESSQSIVMQGFGGTLRQALDVLGNSKPPVTDDKLDFRAFPLKHLPASEAETQIRTLFGIASSNAAVNVSNAREERDRASYYRSREQSEREGKSRDATAPPIPLLRQVAMNMQVSSLERTNSLLVTATPAGLMLVENVLTSIDVPPPGSGQSGSGAAGSGQAWASDSVPVLRVYKVASADEGEVAKTLDVLIPGVVVNEDRRQDAIHVFATPKQHEEVTRLIETLDQNEGEDRIVEVIPLRHANPMATATLLSGMFLNDDRDNRPMIQPELPSRTIVVRGTAAQVAQVRAALIGLGEPSEPTAASVDRVKRISVGGRSAEAIANAAEKILSGDKRFSSSIRVVVPGQTRSQPKTQQGRTDVRANINEDHSFNARGSMFVDVKTVTAKNTVVAPDSASPKEKTSTGDSNQPRPSVSIEVQGDELMVYSGDPAALSDVEETIRELIRQMPDRTNWTVFYLRVAEADQAAIKLLELTRDATSYSLTTDSSVEELPLRILPDKRTNAIFVSGPESKVNEVEGFLEYIDAAEVPGSFLRREPHAIMVQYADVNEIAKLLSSLYKDYLVDPVAEQLKSKSGRDEDNNAQIKATLAIIASGASPGVRLTLAVDNKTGELLVACNDQLFQEIQAVVQQRDLAVRDSKPTVEFIPITGATPGNLVELLNAMSPRVSAETILPSTPTGSNATDKSRTSSSSSNRGR